MIKQIMLAGGLALTLAGCGMSPASQTKNNPSSASSSSVETTTLNYNKLSKADQKKVSFKFKAAKTDANAAGYKVDMTVQNQSNHTVRFDPADFSISVPSEKAGNSKVESNVEGKLIVNKGKKATVKALFANVDEAYFTGAGEFFYANKQFPLAYSYQANVGDGVSSSNLKDTNLISLNQSGQDANASSSSGSSAVTSSSARKNSASSSSNQKSAASSAKTTSKQQYTGKQLALLSNLIFLNQGMQSKSAAQITQILQSQMDTVLYGSGDGTSGSSSFGTTGSYVTYKVSGDTITINHPSTLLGNDASTRSASISQIAPKIFTGVNAALAQKLVAGMKDDHGQDQ